MARDPRLIPAHAGKTVAAWPACAACAAHPRSRGENKATARSLSAASGSSPLTRGKLDFAHVVLAVAGLIPAHAGKTRSGITSWTSGAAHPRSRGENPPRLVCASSSPGSSPLTRGKLLLVLLDGVERGLIPAHAGKTIPLASPVVPGEAHPRSRGENVIVSVLADTKRGSSPLTRGKLQSWLSSTVANGLIPAHAGKTLALPWRIWGPSAHPRSRGENGFGGDAPACAAGSSPLTRGKQGVPRLLDWSFRLIPAHAGKTREN